MVITDSLLIIGSFILEDIPSYIPDSMVLIVEMILHCKPLAVVLEMSLFVLVLHVALVPFVRTWMANHCVFVRKVSLGMELNASIHLAQEDMLPWLLLTRQAVIVFQKTTSGVIRSPMKALSHHTLVEKSPTHQLLALEKEFAQWVGGAINGKVVSHQLAKKSAKVRVSTRGSARRLDVASFKAENVSKGANFCALSVKTPILPRPNAVIWIRVAIFHAKLWNYLTMVK